MGNLTRKTARGLFACQAEQRNLRPGVRRSRLEKGAGGNTLSGFEWICLPAGFSRSPGSGCGHSFTSCLFRAQFFSGAVQLFGRNWKQSNVCIKCRSGSRPVATVEFSPAERWNNGGSPSAAPHCHNHPEAPGWLLFVPSEPPSFFMAEIQNGSRVDVPQVLHNTITQLIYSPNIVDTKLPSHHTPRSCGASTLPS